LFSMQCFLKCMGIQFELVIFKQEACDWIQAFLKL
jgi:hypothetical protein